LVWLPESQCFQREVVSQEVGEGASECAHGAPRVSEAVPLQFRESGGPGGAEVGAFAGDVGL